MALLNRFSRLNDRGETGIFTFIVTKSVTRDFHRDATTKDFCFGYHRWAISFQRPAERVLGVHLLLRNPSPNTACVVDFQLALLNRDHFSRNQVYVKRQAKFTITNPMQGVSRWIQMSELNERRFSNETGEFLFELSLSNMRTIFECDIQLNPNVLTQYKSMLKNNQPPPPQTQPSTSGTPSHAAATAAAPASNNPNSRKNSEQLINLETNCFTFGSFEWSLTIVPLVVPSVRVGGQPQSAASNEQQQHHQHQTSSASSSSSNLLTPNRQQSSSTHSIASSVSSLGGGGGGGSRDKHRLSQPASSGVCAPSHPNMEPVCRVYLNRLSGFDTLCRVRYRVILGHHNQQSAATSGGHSGEFADSRTLDQISDSGGRIRGHQFRNTNILKLIALRSGGQQPNQSSSAGAGATLSGHHSSRGHAHHHHSSGGGGSASLDLRVHIEMFCANTVSEARVPLHRNPNEPPANNCLDRNKQSWCVEADCDSADTLRLKLFFLDLQSVPRNHLRYISWAAYVVRRDPKSGGQRESLAVRHSPHSNYYLQDGMDLGTIMDTDIQVKELNGQPAAYLDQETLLVHIEWVDSLLLFSHLYNNYDSLATVQRYQISRELCAVQSELELLEEKYEQLCKSLGRSGTVDSAVDDATSAAASLSTYQTRQRSDLTSSADSSPVDSPTSGAQRLAPLVTSAKVTNQMQRPKLRADSLQLSALGEPQGQMVAPPAARVGQFNHSMDMNAPAHSQTPPLGGIYANKTPMSFDERLKFSSSTPPDGRLSLPGNSELLSVPGHHHHHHHQHHQQDPLGGRLSPQNSLTRNQLPATPTSSFRRRRQLPQQPQVPSTLDLGALYNQQESQHQRLYAPSASLTGERSGAVTPTGNPPAPLHLLSTLELSSSSSAAVAAMPSTTNSAAAELLAGRLHGISMSSTLGAPTSDYNKSPVQAEVAHTTSAAIDRYPFRRRQLPDELHFSRQASGRAGEPTYVPGIGGKSALELLAGGSSMGGFVQLRRPMNGNQQQHQLRRARLEFGTGQAGQELELTAADMATDEQELRQQFGPRELTDDLAVDIEEEQEQDDDDDERSDNQTDEGNEGEEASSPLTLDELDRRLALGLGVGRPPPHHNQLHHFATRQPAEVAPRAYCSSNLRASLDGPVELIGGDQLEPRPAAAYLRQLAAGRSMDMATAARLRHNYDLDEGNFLASAARPRDMSAAAEQQNYGRL